MELRDSDGRVVLENVLIYDGLGSAPRSGSVLIVDGRIAAAGAVSPSALPHGVRRVDMKGLAVSPGFINLHSHSDTDMLVHRVKTLLMQGITTEVVGNCGEGRSTPPR